MSNPCLKKAHFLLNLLRNGTDMYDSCIAEIRREVQLNSLSLKKIGVSEKKLEELRIKNNIRRAKKLLGYLRRDVGQRNLCIHHLHNEIRKGDLSLKQIDMSEEESASFGFILA